MFGWLLFIEVSQQMKLYFYGFCKVPVPPLNLLSAPALLGGKPLSSSDTVIPIIYR